MLKPLKVVRAKRSMSIDLEYGMFDIEEGKTYVDDETTVFDVYIEAGLRDGSFEEALLGPDTIVVGRPEDLRMVKGAVA
jgi:hypothetical protein